MSNVFLVSWDMTGLETCINVTAIEKEKVWNVLADKNSDGYSLSSLVNAVLLRARFNNQRHYEVYAVEVDESITEDDLRRMFDEQPQMAADLIRSRGSMLHSDRVKQSEVKIV